MPAPHEDLTNGEEKHAEGNHDLAPTRLVNEDNQPASRQRAREGADETERADKLISPMPQQDDATVKYTRAIARATVGILIVTTIYAVFAAFQWWEIVQSVEVTKKIAYVSERQWHDNARPWVALEDHSEDPSKDNVLLEFSDGTPRAKITFAARNGGGSPAFQFILNAHLITHPITEPYESIRPPMKIYECEDWKTLNNLALNKGQTILSQRDKEMTLPITGRDRDSDEPNLPQDDPSEIYLIGCIAYNDSAGTPTEDRPYVPKEYKDVPRYATVFYEQFVRDDGERRIPHTGKSTGKFEPVFTSSYR